MGIYWIFSWLLIYLLSAEAKQKWRPNEDVDSEVLQKMQDFQDALMPLPDYMINFLIRTSASLYLPIRADPGLCRSHSQYTMHSVLKSEIWAIRMIDAASKVHSGVLDGRIQNLGNYDQCLRIEEPEQRFTGQYCMVDAHGLLPNHLDTYFRNMATAYIFPGAVLSFSLCVPSSCDPQDIITHLDQVLGMADLNVSTDKFEVFCSTKEPHQFRTKDWFAVVVCTTIGVLIILSTWYESRTSRMEVSTSDLLSSFSMISNWRELKDMRISSSDISCLNGLRVILAFSVMVTHRYMYASLVPFFNFTSHLEMRNDPWMALIWSGNLATETFFLIAGIVRAYIFLRSRHNGKQINIFKQYIQRYFRVMPSLALGVLLTSTLAIHIYSGPMWDKYVNLHEVLCNNLWWSNLLHISNCVGFPVVCYWPSWYLAADFQMFVLSPLLLLPLFHRPKLGLLLLAGVYLISTAAKTAEAIFKQMHPDVVFIEGPRGDRRLSTAHMNTIYRAATFVIGIAVGYLILEVKNGKMKLNLSKPLIWLCWLLSVSFLVITPWFSTLFIRPSYQDTPWLSAIYMGLIQQLWVLGFAWLILACTLGYGGWLDKMLSWSGFVPLSRLSFGIFLIHVILQSLHIFGMRQPFNMDAFDIVFHCVGDFVASAGLATVLYLAVEAPCSRVINHILRPTAQDAQRKETPRDQQEKKKDM